MTRTPPLGILLMCISLGGPAALIATLRLLRLHHRRFRNQLRSRRGLSRRQQPSRRTPVQPPAAPGE
jgi:hypothetical protein